MQIGKNRSLTTFFPSFEISRLMRPTSQVITGWDQGLLGMQIGEERKLTIPADEGYGAAGFPAWGIPPNGTLEFTLEVLKIE